MSQNSNCDHDHAPTLIPDRVFKIGISLNLLFVLIELYYGNVSHSLALISDAFHNLTDVFGLMLAWLGYYLSLTAGIKRKKVSIFAAAINSGLLLGGSIWLIFEAIERYRNGAQPVAATMMIVAFAGFVINFISAKLFHKDHHHDLNIKSAYLHLMADAAISLGVVVAGAVIYWTGFTWVDPVVSLIISVIIIFGTWGLFFESVRLLSGKTPKNVDLEKVRAVILKNGKIKTIFEIRVRAVSTSENLIEIKTDANEFLSDSGLTHQLMHDFKISRVHPF